MQEQRLHYLLEQVNNDAASAPEIEELAQFIHENKDSALFSAVVSAQIERYTASSSDMALFGENASIASKVLAMQEVLSKREQAENPVRRIPFLLRWWAAAIILLLAGTATYFYVNNRPQQEVTLKTIIEKPDILPGGNRAILTLADGSTILLDSAAIGNLANEGGTKVLKPDAGKLVYQPGIANDEIGYNTIATPNGGQYQIALPDGTKVWLNAASSIRFPTVFANERKVEVTGEVYMEIAKNPKQPFMVSAKDISIQVLGTSFNVNAYTNEPFIKTSLHEGRIKIGNVILKPGEALLGSKVISTNIEQDLAWKNGVFNFNYMDFPAVMRQLARWYNVEVKYEGHIPQKEFRGEMSRALNLSDALELLSVLKVKFRLEGNTLIVVNR